MTNRVPSAPDRRHERRHGHGQQLDLELRDAGGAPPLQAGTWSSSTGALPVKDGKVDGNALSWQVNVTIPLPMTLDCTATVSGDSMNGTVTAGAFGSFPLTGTRV